MPDKSRIRKNILMQRRSLRAEFVNETSKIICDKVCELAIYQSARDVCLYSPIQNEVDVNYLTEVSRSFGKKIWLPKVIDDKMDFYFYGEDIPLIAGKYDILEPQSKERLLSSDDTLIIMPGAVFSEQNDRIGYGGGYYDRYLSEHPECKTLAVCYHFQRVPNLPVESHDIRPMVVVDEERVSYIKT